MAQISAARIRALVMHGERGRVLALALPTVGEQILNMLVGMANTYMVGHLGSAPLAAVGLGNQVVMLVSAFFTAVSTASTALVARSIGAGDRERASLVLEQSVTLGVVIGLPMTLVGLFLSRRVMAWLGAEPDVQILGRDYLGIVSLSFVLMALMFIGNASLRGAGDTKTPLGIMAVVNVINIAVTYIFLNGWGLWEPMGVKSPALGSAAARSAGALIVLVLLIRGRGGLKLGTAHLFRPNWAILKSLANVGAPAGAEGILMNLGQVTFAAIVASLGTVAYAAHQIANTTSSASFMPGFGFGVAATTLTGQHLGAKDPEGAKRCAFEAWRLALVLTTLMGIGMFFGARQIVSGFISEPDVIQKGIICVQILAFAQPGVATLLVYSGALRGAGDTRFTMLISAASIWLVRVPVARFLAISLGLGLTGVWITVSAEMWVRAILFWLRHRSGRWQRILL